MATFQTPPFHPFHPYNLECLLPVSNKMILGLPSAMVRATAQRSYGFFKYATLLTVSRLRLTPILGCFTPRVVGGLGRGSAESRPMVTWTGDGRPGQPRSKSSNGDPPLAIAQLQKPVAFSHVTRATLPAAQHCLKVVVRFASRLMGTGSLCSDFELGMSFATSIMFVRSHATDPRSPLPSAATARAERLRYGIKAQGFKFRCFNAYP